MTRSIRALTRYRFICFAVIGVLVALGLGSKAYEGWGQRWINDFSGDILFGIFWIWVMGVWELHWRAKRIAIATFLVISLVEFTQLIPFPATWQSQFWWRLLLGTTFSWPDFICYAIGCIIGGLSLSWIRSITGVSQCQPPSHPN